MGWVFGPLALVCLLIAPQADALTVLTEGKTLRFYKRPGSSAGSAVVRFKNDPALATLESPLCPAATSIQLTTYRNPGTVFELPCEKWSPVRNGYQYRDASGSVGGVKRIRYQTGTLKVSIRGPLYEHRPGPDAFAQLWLNIDETRYMGRFHDLHRNDNVSIRSRKPTLEGSVVEALFWRMLHDDPNLDITTLEAAEAAVARRSSDGRSWFLKGMTHLRHYQRITPNQHTPGPASVGQLVAAKEAFDHAAETIDYDPRLVGFRGAATFSVGFATGDSAAMDAGLAFLRESFALDPLFNVFNFVGTVAAVVDASDPLYAEAMLYLDQAIQTALNCLGTLPEVCQNTGLAPHNLQGTFIMFGDLFAKDGNAESAKLWYMLATSPAWEGHDDWMFFPELQNRLDNLNANIVLWQDGNPINDPGISGAFGEYACVTCHHR